MFSREDGRRLRDALGPMDFHTPAPRSDLLRAYCDFYGLNFGNSHTPVSHRIGYFDSGDFRIVCQYFHIPPAQQRGTMFLLHGYYDHVGLYSHLIQHCLQAGFAVAIFDLPGHGLSSGTESSIASFRQYSAALLACLQLAQQQNVNTPWWLVGQSTGGAVIIDSILEDQLTTRFDFDKIVLLAPLLQPRSWSRSRMLFSMTRWFLKSTRRTFASNSHDPEFLNFLRNSDKLQSRVLQRDWVLAMIDFQNRFLRNPPVQHPLHIIQGSADGTVDWEYNVPRIIAKFPGSKSYMIAGAGHHLVNESQPYRDRVFSLIDEITRADAN